MWKGEFMRNKLTVSILILAFWCSTSLAQNSGDENKIILAPYLWGTSLNGTSTVGNLPPLDIDASFSDILSNLNFALSLHTEFHTGPWRIVVDPMYVALEVDVPPLLPLPGATGSNMEVTMWLIEVWGGYEITDGWEAIGGIRYQDQEIKLSGLPNPPFSSSLGVNDSWSDWFVGVRYNTDLGAKWLLTVRGDVVVAGDSDTSYNAQVFFNRRFGETMALNLGYRYLKDDYNNPGVYAWDMVQQGPVVGYTWVF
jgi:hypothetical protein